MKRRNFILLSSAGVAAIAFPSLYFKYGDFEYNKSLSEPELLSHIWDDNTVYKIGKLYREKFPDEDSERKLVKLLSKNDLSDNGDIKELMLQQIQQDYKQERIVMLDGWLLSVSEARQCALFSFTPIN